MGRFIFKRNDTHCKRCFTPLLVFFHTYFYRSLNSDMITFAFGLASQAQANEAVLTLKLAYISLVFFDSFPNFRGSPLFFRVQWTTYILHYISIQSGYPIFETPSQNSHDVTTSKHHATTGATSQTLGMPSEDNRGTIYNSLHIKALAPRL